MGGNGKHRWIISFSRASSLSLRSKKGPREPPKEFICPISGSMMSDPVIVSSGQTYERVSVQVCKDLGFCPPLETGPPLDFTAVIPNLALKSAISSWCESTGAVHPPPPDYMSVEKLVRRKIPYDGEASSGTIRVSERELLKCVAENYPPVIRTQAVSELAQRVGDRFCSGSSSEESVIVAETPLSLKKRPCCYSSSSSSSEFFDFETLNPTQTLSPNAEPNPEEEELVLKLRSRDVFEQEKAVSSLRNISKTRPASRAALCTSRLLSALKPLLVSRYISVQVDATASVVNLSLEATNKTKIVRAGTVPYLIDVLKGGFSESQGHAAGALFSLALEDENKMAIGALGALQPLLHALRSESQQTRQDSALALYHLTLMNINRVKLVMLNAIPTLLEMVRSGNLASRVLLILCNLAACAEGRTMMLDSHGIEILIELLREGEGKGLESTIENCISALFTLSQGNFRFRSLLKEANGVEVLKDVRKQGSQRAKDKAKRMLEMMSEREDRLRGRSLEWDLFLESGELRQSQ
ncbi:hypothetical protein SAY86_021288 [Trapa natans]|uniref:RING-type E3 ubiquitin transferase n=1 Tax=Trapa natans TaxID=22666 RepID=A0AAN7MB77_TRANT|nr:hypothetical protein SAY86_021288 [Trapa natans]